MSQNFRHASSGSADRGSCCICASRASTSASVASLLLRWAGYSSIGSGWSRTDLHDAVDVRWMAHRVQDHHQADVGMTHEIDAIDLEVAPQGIEVVDVLLHAASQFGALVRRPPSARDSARRRRPSSADRRGSGSPRTVHAVRDEEHSRSVAHRSDEQPHVVGHRHKDFAGRHANLRRKQKAATGRGFEESISVCVAVTGRS